MVDHKTAAQLAQLARLSVSAQRLGIAIKLFGAALDTFRNTAKIDAAAADAMRFEIHSRLDAALDLQLEVGTINRSLNECSR